MSQIKFKFIQALESITPTYDSVLNVGDKLTDIFSKLQALLLTHTTRVTLSTTSTGGINTTADFDMGTLTIPANRLRVGDVIIFNTVQNVAKGTGNRNFISYFKINGTKIVVQTQSMGVSSFTAANTMLCGMITVRSIGTSGVLVYSATGSYRSISNPNVFSSLVSANPTFIVDTTQNIDITTGASFSTANASNLISSFGGEIKIS
jgi:hypothetical protein